MADAVTTLLCPARYPQPQQEIQVTKTRTAVFAGLLLAVQGCAAPAEPAPPAQEACSASSPCSHDDTRSADYGWSEQHVKLRDGRTITCVTFVDVQKAGISCDWNAR
jgi:hypothetical protein